MDLFAVTICIGPSLCLKAMAASFLLWTQKPVSFGLQIRQKKGTRRVSIEKPNFLQRWIYNFFLLQPNAILIVKWWNYLSVISGLSMMPSHHQSADLRPC